MCRKSVGARGMDYINANNDNMNVIYMVNKQIDSERNKKLAAIPATSQRYMDLFNWAKFVV